MITQTERTERIKIVNEIINKIASCGRHFFIEDGTAYFILYKNKRLYLANHNGKEIFLHTKYGYPPRNFLHGGTMWGLMKDFIEFIKTGEHTNGNNGYGGLWCIHWGYTESDMDEIRVLAKKLNYLK